MTLWWSTEEYVLRIVPVPTWVNGPMKTPAQIIDPGST
jgi:hypothetical protein